MKSTVKPHIKLAEYTLNTVRQYVAVDGPSGKLIVAYGGSFKECYENYVRNRAGCHP